MRTQNTEKTHVFSDPSCTGWCPFIYKGLMNMESGLTLEPIQYGICPSRDPFIQLGPDYP